MYFGHIVANYCEDVEVEHFQRLYKYASDREEEAFHNISKSAESSSRAVVSNVSQPTYSTSQNFDHVVCCKQYELIKEETTFFTFAY